jgi:hypothetical protein
MRYFGLVKSAACCGGGWNFDEFAGFYVVSVAVDGMGRSPLLFVVD